MNMKFIIVLLLLNALISCSNFSKKSHLRIRTRYLKKVFLRAQPHCSWGYELRRVNNVGHCQPSWWYVLMIICCVIIGLTICCTLLGCLCCCCSDGETQYSEVTTKKDTSRMDIPENVDKYIKEDLNPLESEGDNTTEIDEPFLVPFWKMPFKQNLSEAWTFLINGLSMALIYSANSVSILIIFIYIDK